MIVASLLQIIKLFHQFCGPNQWVRFFLQMSAERTSRRAAAPTLAQWRPPQAVDAELGTGTKAGGPPQAVDAEKVTGRAAERCCAYCRSTERRNDAPTMLRMLVTTPSYMRKNPLQMKHSGF
jgi:hypothetical protein